MRRVLVVIGLFFISFYCFSNETYMVTRTDGSVAYISHWRWIDDSREEFLFTHDNWQTSGRIRITTLNQNSLLHEMER